MEITFQGLNPVVSFAFLALLAGIVFLLSWWSYSYLTTITPFKRWSLITFRGTALLILIVLLLNPFIRVDEIEVKKPEIAVYLDDSKSMSVTRGQYDGWNSYGQIIDSFEFDGIPEVNFRFYRFAGNVTPVEDTELELEGSDTNLDNVIRHMRDHSGQSVAGILFSDGIITRGRMPVYNASELSISLFTIPVGDTTQIRDIAITDLFTNETGYTNTRQPVDVSVTQNGFTNETATVQLLQNDRILEETELRFQNDPTSHSLSFELEIEETGLHNFEIFIPVLEGEATAENNRYPFSVEVLDDKTRIVHFAFEIHPDVRALRTILQTDQSLELTTRTWLGNRFSEGPLQTLDDDIDLVIIHGVPPSGLNDFELFYEQYPVLQFSTPALSAVNLNRAVIPMRISGSGSVFDIRPRFAESAETHPVLELDPVNFSRMPVLNTLYADYSVPVTTTVLLKATFEDTPADIPLLTLEETGNVRRSMVNAFNWYRYTQSSNEQARNFAKTLMTNLISWTSTDPDRRNLNISPVKRVFQENDEIQFRASLTNETGEPEQDAVIEIIITGMDIEEQNFTMRNRNRGNYDLNIGNLTAGSYEFRAEARKAGRVIDEQTGAFNVTVSTVEFIDTKRDDELLRQLAEVSGGSFLENQNREELMEELQIRNLIDSIEERHTSFRFLYENVFWFILVLLLLSGEWILRRTLALP